MMTPFDTNLGQTQRESHDIASPDGLNPLPEGEVTAGGQNTGSGRTLV